MPTPFPPVILFDLDDTIIDHTGGVDAAWRGALGDHVEAADHEDIRVAVREISRWYWSDAERHRVGRADLRAVTVEIVREALLRTGQDDAELARRVAHRYRDLREAAYFPLPGAVETLFALREAGVRLGLVTNGNADEQRGKIARFNLASFFELICIEGELGYGKPDVRVYAHVVERLNVEPGEAWMVGDNLEWDVFAPMRIGLAGVWVDRFDRRVPADAPVQPTRVVASIAELVDTRAAS